MATAKYAVGAAGLKPADYANMAAVAASQTAMTAVASSQTAMTAVINNSTALNAVVSSSTAMAAIFRSSTAMTAVQNNASAWAIFSNASSAVMGKTVAELAGLNPSGYADMNAIASSSTAMAAIAASSTALSAIAASTTALDAIYAKKKRMSGARASLSGKFIILQISDGNAFDTSQYGYATLSDGSKPNWGSYKAKYAYFKQYKKIATYMKNDTDSDDWIDYFQC